MTVTLTWVVVIYFTDSFFLNTTLIFNHTAGQEFIPKNANDIYERKVPKAQIPTNQSSVVVVACHHEQAAAARRLFYPIQPAARATRESKSLWEKSFSRF